MPEYTVERYAEFVNRMLAMGKTRRSLTLTKDHTDILTMSDVTSGAEGTAVAVKAPAGQYISIAGTRQVDGVTEQAHTIWLKFADTGGTEIASERLIKMRIKKTSQDLVYGPAGPYALFNQSTYKDMFRPVEGVFIEANATLEFRVNPNVSIDDDNSEAMIQCDLWS